MKYIFFFAAIAMLGFTAGAQVGINPSGAAPNDKAALDLDFTNKGLLPPRMSSAQRDAIGSPVPAGLTIYNTTTNCLEVYTGGAWKGMCNGDNCSTPPATPTAGSHVVAETSITWNWSAVSGASGYKYNTANDYSTAVSAGTATSYAQSGLVCATSYTLYVWAHNACGASSAATFTQSTSVCPCIVGNTGPGGGKIFYCGSAYPGFQGLESMASDLSYNTPSWGCVNAQQYIMNDAIGAGKTNSADLDANCADVNMAADRCENLVSGGKSDWFLPSKLELQQMYIQRNTIGGFEGGDYWKSHYWSSTEHSQFKGWTVYFSNGSYDDVSKANNVCSVRCIRTI
jgi:hypothetical protein